MSDKPIRIAIVRQNYTPFGGAERFVERALGALEKQGVAVSLIARRWPADGARSGVVCNPFYLGRLWRDVGFARCVQRVMAQSEFDLVQSHERIAGCDLFRAGDGVHAAWLEWRGRRAGFLARLWPRLSPWHRYVLAAEARMFRHPRLKAVICNSRLVRDEIMRLYAVDPAKLHVIYNGIDLEAFHPELAASHRVSVRADLGLAGDVPIFVFVGSGFARKGVATLIRAAALMHNRNARFWIIGQDKHGTRYARLAKRLGVAERFHFLGAQRDVRPYLAAADAFVLPTQYDPLPNAALEALACGLPVIVSDSCGVAELIRPGESGFICPAEDAPALRQHLDTLARPGIAHAMRPAARAAVAHLGLEAMTERLIALYHSLLLRRTDGADFGA